MSGAALIDELIRRGSTFAAFRSPGQNALAYIQHTAELRVAERGQRCFVLAPFEPTDGPPLCIHPDAILALDDDRAKLDSFASEVRPPHALQRGWDRAGYHRAVDTAVAAIRAGQLRKVVLARTIDADLTGTTPGALFEAAARALPDAFIAIAFTERFGLWLGASPERLLTVRGKQVDVDALAGTMPASLAPHDAEAWGVKEREEQAVVTRMILITLGEAGVTDLKTSDVRVRHAGPVAHLHTRVTGSMSGADALILAQALHPTPAVGGTPTNEAMRYIRTNEPRSRSLYAGYWGPMEAESTDLYVNIRCMELFSGSALLHVGAGITSGSDPQRECDEVERKARTWLDLLDAQRPLG